MEKAPAATPYILYWSTYPVQVHSGQELSLHALGVRYNRVSHRTGHQLMRSFYRHRQKYLYSGVSQHVCVCVCVCVSSETKDIGKFPSGVRLEFRGTRMCHE